jgi:hypothetical protein
LKAPFGPSRVLFPERQPGLLVALIEHHSSLHPDGRLPRPSGWVVIGVVAALLTVTGIAARGVSDNGFRLGSQFVWRFTCLIYFAAVIAGPLARLIPSETLRRICQGRRQLVWGFCVSLGVYLVSVLLPNTPPLPGGDSLTAGMAIFVGFAGLLASVIAYCASQPAAHFLGERASRTMMHVGMATFWLAYAASGLSHISGPHRPDMFYGFSLSLMVLALLLRFADCFLAKWKAFRGTI